MIIIADENIHRRISSRLADDGHEVEHIGDLTPGIDDDAVLAFAVARGALLITADLDFGEVVYRQRSRHTGVLLLRLGDLPRDQQVELVSSTVRLHLAELVEAFSVLDQSRLRIRRSP